MERKYTNEDVEYNRLNNEQLMRIDKIYSDGAVVTSIILIYFINCIGALFGAYKYMFEYGAQIGDVAIYPISLLSVILFLFPVLLCYTFALKSKEMLDSIISLSNFIKVYFEKPSLKKDGIKGKKWESMHKNTMLPCINNERKEYYYIAVFSVVLMIISAVIEIMVLEYLSLLLTFPFYFVVFTKLSSVAIAIKFVYTIRRKTDMKAVLSQVESTALYYNYQKNLLAESEDIERDIEKAGKNDLIFNIFLMKNHIPPYKATELEKLLYNEEYNKSDKVVNMVYKKAKKICKGKQTQRDIISSFIGLE